MEQKTERNGAFDILKGIGIVFMVMNHANMGVIFDRYVSGLNMPLFFLISGYFFNPQKHCTFISYLRKKAKNLLIPYCMFAGLTLLVCMSVNLIVKQPIFDMKKALVGLIWSNQSLLPITGAVWFLQCLFVAEIAFWLLYHAFGKKFILIPVLLLGIGSVLLSYFKISLPFSIDSSMTAILFYYIGFKFQIYPFKEYFVKSESKLLFKQALFGIVSLIISAILIFLNGDVNIRTCTYSIYAVYILAAVLATFGWMEFSVIFSVGTKKIIKIFSGATQYIGINSIYYLGFNQLLIIGMYKFFTRVFGIESTPMKAVRNLLTCAITLLLISLLSHVINKIKLKGLFGK